MSDLPVPAHYQAAADAVVAHLCLLRGGAPFLSPMDAWQLVQWFDAGVRPEDLVIALERAADARRSSPGKRRLGLGAAKRHLGKAVPGRIRPAGPAESPWGPLLDGLGGADPLREALAALSPADPDAEARAQAAIRAWLASGWDALGDPARDALRAEAGAGLADLLALLGDPELGQELVEEAARDRFRQRFPRLAAATVRALLRPTPAPEAPVDETLPDDFAAALAASPAALARWATLPPSHRREHLAAIAEAKKPATRARRIASAVAMLER